MVASKKLILLFDGGCPFCLREISFLRKRDSSNCIEFVDIDDPGYDPKLFKGISYREAMGRIHAITSSGEVIRDIRVFQEAYRLVGLGWVYAPTRWPAVSFFVNSFYIFWAKRRLSWTRRPSLDQLCNIKGFPDEGKEE